MIGNDKGWSKTVEDVAVTVTDEDVKGQGSEESLYIIVHYELICLREVLARMPQIRLFLLIFPLLNRAFLKVKSIYPGFSKKRVQFF
jgi:hypothetical protein